MAVAESVPFGGRRQRLMAEHFATMADVHRLTGELPEDADQLPTADGRGKTVEESARRLARMLGRDAAIRRPRGLAAAGVRISRSGSCRPCTPPSIACCRAACSAMTRRSSAPASAVSSLRPLAERLRRPYVDFASLVEGEPATREWAARCAPAAAVAILAADGW